MQFWAILWTYKQRIVNLKFSNVLYVYVLSFIAVLSEKLKNFRHLNLMVELHYSHQINQFGVFWVVFVHILYWCAMIFMS